MAKKDRTGNRKTRDQRKQFRVPELGYYLIVTDTGKMNYRLLMRMENENMQKDACFQNFGSGRFFIFHFIRR